MTRLEANRRIVELLSLAVEKHPDWRFSQLMVNLGLVKHSSQDEFYVESEEILNRMYSKEK